MNPETEFVARYQTGADRREHEVREIARELRHILRSLGISARVEHRVKSVSSTWRKMMHYSLELEEVHDLLAARVIVDTVEECYQVLGRVYETWPGHGERFKDYIRHPKDNGYQSLHVTFFAGEGPLFELQIRTEQMHWNSLSGTAAHWRYKTPIPEKVRRASDPTTAAA